MSPNAFVFTVVGFVVAAFNPPAARTPCSLPERLAASNRSARNPMSRARKSSIETGSLDFASAAPQVATIRSTTLSRCRSIASSASAACSTGCAQHTAAETSDATERKTDVDDRMAGEANHWRMTTSQSCAGRFPPAPHAGRRTLRPANQAVKRGTSRGRTPARAIRTIDVVPLRRAST
jgi:hypothetical protein